MAKRILLLCIATMIVQLLSGCVFVYPSSEVYSLGNFVWFDLRYNGIQDEDETGIAGVAVNLYLVGATDEDIELTASTETDARGFYTFEDLHEGRYMLEFIPPLDYTLTLQDQGEDDDLDSDADPATGRTEVFQLGRDEDRWDAGMLLLAPAPTATFTSSPIPPATATDTPTPMLTQAPTATLEVTRAGLSGEGSFVHFDDPSGDAQNCQTEASVEDEEVDIRQTLVQRQDGHLWVTVSLGSPLVRDYSFAVLIYIIYGDVALAFLWETHDGVLRIGQINPQTGELILEVEEGGMEITHDRTLGTIQFGLHADLIPGQVERVFVSSFHTPTEGESKHCDVAGPYTLPSPVE